MYVTLIMLKMSKISKKFLVVAVVLLVFRRTSGDDTCYDFEIKVPDCFRNGGVNCDGYTFDFKIYEDCPQDVIILEFQDESLVIDDCNGLIASYPNGSISLTKSLDAEDTMETNSQICTNFVNGTNLALFTTLDVNEYPPEPTDVAYQESLAVDEGYTGSILNFSYSDSDYGEYLTMEFEEMYENSPFKVTKLVTNPISEKVVYSLSITTALDYEDIQFYPVEVIFSSSDSRGTSSSATQIFLVSVNDIGDQPPEFINSSPFVNLDEGEAGRDVFTVVAVDGDRSVNNNITYEILSGNDEKYFVIDEDTGVVSNDKEIDRESLLSEYFILEIQALEVDENGNPVEAPNSATEVLDINIIDVNDNIPTFDKSKYSVSTPEVDSLTGEKHVLDDLTILVEDMDQGSAGRYTITANNTNVIISPSTGTGETELTLSITYSDEFDFEKSSSFTVLVELTAKEEALPLLHHSSVELEITITDVNDNYPIFTEPEYEANPNETIESGTEIARVAATDADGSSELNTDSIIYSLERCDELDIDETTGLVTLSYKTKLDYETSPEFDCTVIAKDMFGESESSLRNETTLFIIVHDINDEKPEFVSIDNDVNLSEDSETGTLVTEFVVFDPDTTNSLIVTLNFSDALFESWFAIEFDEESSSGKIVTQASMDREVASQITMNVIATDRNTEVSGMESISESVKITLEDMNDEAPYFIDDYSNQEVEEELSIGTTVFKVIAQDNDIDDSITYSISENDYLIIDQDSGEVMTAVRIDREEIAEFNVDIYATDEVGNFDKVKVLVTVIDINDQEPYYTGIIYGDFLPTSTEGDLIALFEFTDLDTDDSLSFYTNDDFEWSNGINIDEPFIVENVDNRSGKLLLNVDAKGLSGYCSFTITAEDEAKHAGVASVEVYAISEDYIEEFIFNNEVTSVRIVQQQVEEAFTSAFGYECITDYIEEAKDDSNVVLEGQTSYQAHFIMKEEKELVETVTIERLGSDGRVIASLNEDLDPLVLDCIGQCYIDDGQSDADSLRNYKVSLGVVTTLSLLFIFLIVTLYIRKTGRLKLQLKAASIATNSETTEKNDKIEQHVPGSNKFIVQGTNPIWNLNEDKLKFESDTESTASGGSILVGIEDDPTFESYKLSSEVPGPFVIKNRGLSTCTEESA